VSTFGTNKEMSRLRVNCIGRFSGHYFPPNRLSPTTWGAMRSPASEIVPTYANVSRTLYPKLYPNSAVDSGIRTNRG